MKPLLALVVVLPTFVFAQDATSSAIASLQSGVICAPPTVGTVEAPGTVAGVTNVIAEDPPFVSLNNRVPAVIGIGFGAKTMAQDFTGISDVTITVTHPPMGDAGATSQTFQSSISGTSPSLTFYQFDFDYELLPGAWTMEASIAGKVLYRSAFTVLPPAKVPELAAVCGFEDLLS